MRSEVLATYFGVGHVLVASSPLGRVHGRCCKELSQFFRGPNVLTFFFTGSEEDRGVILRHTVQGPTHRRTDRQVG